MKEHRRPPIEFGPNPTPRYIAEPLLDVADRLTKDLKKLHARARHAAKKDKRLGTQRCQLIALTGYGEMIYQFLARLGEIPKGSVAIFVCGVNALAGGRVFEAAGYTLTSVGTDEPYPRAHVNGLLYRWLLAGHCEFLYENLGLPELEQIREALRLEGQSLPRPDEFRSRLKAATKEAIRSRLRTKGQVAKGGRR